MNPARVKMNADRSWYELLALPASSNEKQHKFTVMEIQSKRIMCLNPPFLTQLVAYGKTFQISDDCRANTKGLFIISDNLYALFV